MESERPLDWNVLTNGPDILARKGPRGTVEGDGLRVSRLRYGQVKVVAEESSWKPYWGKPAVRNFGGGEGNVSTVWRLFATQPERADTTAVDRPTLGRAFSPLGGSVMVSMRLLSRDQSHRRAAHVMRAVRRPIRSSLKTRGLQECLMEGSGKATRAYLVLLQGGPDGIN